MTQSELFQTAVKKAKTGQRRQARALLLELVETQPQHELAWLWLSELVEDPEDKIIALENALTLNPQRPQTQKRLHQLRQKHPAVQQADSSFSANGASRPASPEAVEFEHIRQQFAAGAVLQGRQQLAAFLRHNVNHEAAWWLMAQQADSQMNLIRSLDHLLRLNPQHPEAPAMVASITPDDEQLFQMGRLHERLAEWETAVQYYKRALKFARNQTRPLIQTRLTYVEERRKLTNIKITSPTATVLRLASGPTILYTLLVMVQSGLNPRQISLALCTGNILFLAGLLLIGAFAYTPNHPWLERLRETAVPREDTFWRNIGLTFVIVSILLLFLLSFSRLIHFFTGLNI